MIRIRRRKFPGFLRPWGRVGLLASAMLLCGSGGSVQNPASPPGPPAASPPAVLNGLAAPTTAQRTGEAKQSKLEETRTDAAELSALADQIRDELNKMNMNVLPLDIIAKTEKVEQLAKKIKGEAHEH